MQRVWKGSMVSTMERAREEKTPGRGPTHGNFSTKGIRQHMRRQYFFCDLRQYEKVRAGDSNLGHDHRHYLSDQVAPGAVTDEHHMRFDIRMGVGTQLLTFRRDRRGRFHIARARCQNGDSLVALQDTSQCCEH
jgi:hypothetical protein